MSAKRNLELQSKIFVILIFFLNKLIRDAKILKLFHLYQFFYYFCKTIRIIMEAKNINTTIYVAKVEELDDKDRQLVETSIEATNNSYAPYSRFHVGAAVRLDNGVIIPGCNQENAALGVTICAERTALFAAGAQYPKAKVEAIAITARNADGLLDEPVSPCGTCRQAMVETEKRSGKKLRILLNGKNSVYIIEGIGALLPLTFSDEQL